MLEDFNDGTGGKLSSLIAMANGQALLFEKALGSLLDLVRELEELQRLIDPLEPMAYEQ